VINLSSRAARAAQPPAARTSLHPPSAAQRALPRRLLRVPLGAVGTRSASADAKLLQRARSTGVARTLWSHSWSRRLLPDYLSGFSKINNRNRSSTTSAMPSATLFRRQLSSPSLSSTASAWRISIRRTGSGRAVALCRRAARAGAHGEGARRARDPGEAAACGRVLAMIPGEAAFRRRPEADHRRPRLTLHDFSPRGDARSAFLQHRPPQPRRHARLHQDAARAADGVGLR